MTPRIRAFTPSDQSDARTLILAGLAERFGSVDESRNPDLDDIAANYLARGDAFAVAEMGSALVGTAALHFEPDGATCQIVRVSVRREWRRQGIARALVASLLEVARERGRRRIWIETDEPWHDAIALYEGLGFRIFARRDDLVFLELTLEASDGHARSSLSQPW